jgi:hypothetical protein
MLLFQPCEMTNRSVTPLSAQVSAALCRAPASTASPLLLTANSQ